MSSRLEILAKKTERPLPQLTRDLERCKRDLDNFGYCLLENALSAEALNASKTRLEEQAEAERQRGIAYEDGGPTQRWGNFRDEEGRMTSAAFTAEHGGINQRVWMLVNKGKIFCDIVEHEDAHTLTRHVLGDEYQISSFTANIAKKGGTPMDLHSDQWWMPPPVRRGRAPIPVGSITRDDGGEERSPDAPMIAPPACLNIMWMLSDFTADIGATRIVPGSHLSGRQPKEGLYSESDVIAAEAPAGSAMFFEGRLWHGTGSNITDQPRLGILLTFCGPQFRPAENYTVAVAPEVIADASPLMRALLGFKTWNAYGRIDGPATEYFEPGEKSPGELYPE